MSYQMKEGSLGHICCIHNIFIYYLIIELVLEGQKLVQLLFISITTSVPNLIIFLLTVHRAAILPFAQ